MFRKLWYRVVDTVVTYYSALLTGIAVSILTSLITVNTWFSDRRIFTVKELEHTHSVDRIMRDSVKKCGHSSYISWIRVEKFYPSFISRFFYKILHLNDKDIPYIGTFQNVVGYITPNDITDIKYLNDIYQDSWIFDQDSTKALLETSEGDIFSVTIDKAFNNNYRTIYELMARTKTKINVIYITPVYWDEDIIWVFSLSFADEGKSTCNNKEEIIRQIAKFAKGRILELDVREINKKY